MRVNDPSALVGCDASAAAMLEKEAIDRVVRCPFDLSVQILLVPVLWRKCIEIVVVTREAVPDIGPDAESSPIVETELAGPTDSAAAHDGCTGCGLLGDPLFECLVCRGEGEEARDGVFQLVSVAIFLALAVLSSEDTLGRPARRCLFGACPSFRNDQARRPKSEEPTVLSMPASRLPRQPVGVPGLDGPGQEGIARGQELPASRDLNISVFGVPLTVLGRVDVEMLRCENLRIGWHLRIVHTESLGRCDPICK